MKRLLLAAALVVPLAVPAFADKNMSVDEKVNKLKSRLDLTDEQVTQVRPVIQDYMTRKQQLDQDKHQRLRPLLTPEQQRKLDDMKDKRD